MKLFGWYESSHRRLELWSIVAAVIPTALAAADMNFFFHLPEFLVDMYIALGYPGGIIFLILIGGPHGGGNRIVSTIAAVIGTYVNALVYFWIARGVSTLYEKIKRTSL